LDESENIEHILVPAGQNDGINKQKTQLQMLQVTREHKWALQQEIIIKNMIFFIWDQKIQLLVRNMKELIESEALKIFLSSA